MSNYYLNSLGSGTWPLDTPEKGAVSFNQFFQILNSNDSIVTVNDNIYVVSDINEPSDIYECYSINEASVIGIDSKTTRIYLNDSCLNSGTYINLGIWTDNENYGQLLENPVEIRNCHLWCSGEAEIYAFSERYQTYETYDGISHSYLTTQNPSLKVSNCIFENFLDEAIRIVPTAVFNKIILINNTFYNCDKVSIIIDNFQFGAGVIDTLKVCNNILKSNGTHIYDNFIIDLDFTAYSGSITNFIHKSNCTNYTFQYSLNGIDIPLDSSEIEGDPLFFGSGEEPLALQQTSPCVNVGYLDDEMELTDILGNTRNSTFCMGALELVIATTNDLEGEGMSQVPVWREYTPRLDSKNENQAKFVLVTDISSTVYYVLLPGGTSIAPTSLEVIAGTGHGGELPISSGSISLVAYEYTFLDIVDLSNNTNYDVFFVATDGGTGVQETPSLVNFLTDYRFYVDLSSVSSGNLGTQESPWSFVDWQTNISSIPTVSTFFMRGSYEYTEEANIVWRSFAYRCAYLPWDLSLYGPYRIHITNSTAALQDLDYVSGLVLQSDCSRTNVQCNLNSTCYNCFFVINEPNGTQIFGTKNGCTFISSKNLSSGSVFNDCIVIINSEQPSDKLFFGVTFNNCATNFPTIEDLGDIYVNSQTSVLFPTMPSWNSPESDFSVETLYANITTPPQPGYGYPEYTNYVTDLFGNPRTGIGAGSMASEETPVWVLTPITTKIHYKYINFSMELDSDCKVYFVAIKGGTNSPTSTQVKNGKDSEDKTVINGNFGNVETLANQEAKITVTNVSYGVYDFYDVYFVAEDDLGNLQEMPFKVSVNVPQLEPINPKIPGSSFERQIIAGKGNSDLLLPKVISLFRGLVLPNMRKYKE